MKTRNGKDILSIMNKFKRLLLTCRILCLVLPVSAQRFEVIRDTIVINPSWLTPDSPRCEVQKVIEYHKNYYCLCKIVFPSDSYYSNINNVTPFNRLDNYYVLQINAIDKSRKTVPLPSRLEYGRRAFPQILFVRRDSLILKWTESYQRDRYEMKNSKLTEEAFDYCFDPKTGTWTETLLTNDDVYEDRRWLITNADVIPYHPFSIYTDKQTKKQHIFLGFPYRTIRKGNSFYWISQKHLSIIENPSDSISYTGNINTELEHNRQIPSSEAKELIRTIADQTFPHSHPLTEEEMRYGYQTMMLTGFFVKDQLYLVMDSPDTGTYIAAYRNHRLEKVLDLGFRYRPFSNPAMRISENFIPNNQANWWFRDYDTHNIIYLSIKGKKIKITYFINNDNYE